MILIVIPTALRTNSTVNSTAIKVVLLVVIPTALRTKYSTVNSTAIKVVLLVVIPTTLRVYSNDIKLYSELY